MSTFIFFSCVFIVAGVCLVFSCSFHWIARSMRISMLITEKGQCYWTNILSMYWTWIGNATHIYKHTHTDTRTQTHMITHVYLTCIIDCVVCKYHVHIHHISMHTYTVYIYIITKVGLFNQGFVTYPNGILETILNSSETILSSSGTILDLGQLWAVTVTET